MIFTNQTLKSFFVKYPHLKGKVLQTARLHKIKWYTFKPYVAQDEEGVVANGSDSIVKVSISKEEVAELEAKKLAESKEEFRWEEIDFKERNSRKVHPFDEARANLKKAKKAKAHPKIIEVLEKKVSYEARLTHFILTKGGFLEQLQQSNIKNQVVQQLNDDTNEWVTISEKLSSWDIGDAFKRITKESRAKGLYKAFRIITLPS